MSALCQKRTSTISFDQVVGNGKYARWNREPERLSSRQINNELEFRRLLDRKIRRTCALENLIHITCSTPEEVHLIRAIGDEAAIRREIAEKVNCRHTVLRGEFGNPLAMNPIMTVWQNEKATVYSLPTLRMAFSMSASLCTWIGIDSIPSKDVPALIDCKNSP